MEEIPEGVTRTIAGAYTDLEKCVSAAVRVPDGRIEILLDLAEGRATPSIHSNSTGDLLLGECLLSEVSDLDFPRALRGPVVYPLFFEGG